MVHMEEEKPRGAHARQANRSHDDSYLRASENEGYKAYQRAMHAKMPEQTNASANDPSDLQRYSRGNYGSGSGAASRRSRGAHGAGNAPRQFDFGDAKSRGKKKPTKHKVLKRVLIALLAIVAIAAVAAGIYLFKLNEALAYDDKEMGAKVAQAVTAPKPDEPYYILLIGSDSREGAEGSDAKWAGVNQDGSDAHADVMMLARIDEKNKQLSLLTIPRDTPWLFSDGKYGKLNYTYTMDRAPGAVKAVEQIAGVPISHVVEIRMSGLMQLVDTLGGITVDVPVQIDYHEALTSQEVSIAPGVQKLNGMQTEVFARERLAYKDGDKSRQGVVRQIVEAILSEIKSKPIWEMPKVLLSCATCVDTDRNAIEVLRIIMRLGRDAKIYQGTAPWAGAQNPNAGNQWLCFQDPEGWQRVMEVFVAGGDPSTVSYEGDSTTVAGS